MKKTSLAREIRHDKVRRAREMSFDERLTAGAKLYAEQMRLVRSLIAGLHPDWTDEQVNAEIHRREQLLRQRNTKKYYSASPPSEGDKTDNATERHA